MSYNKNITFVRWGNLSSQKHKISKDPNDWGFHTPPTERGFYAFPKGYVEPFLLGGAGEGSLQNGRYSKFKDKSGKVYKIKGADFDQFKKKFNKDIQNRLKLPYTIDHYVNNWFEEKDQNNEDVTYDDFLEEMKNGIWEVYIENKPIYFSYNGLIWHHLFSENPPLDKEYPNYIKIVGTWVLTDIDTYIRCLNAETTRLRYEAAFKGYYNYEDEKREYGVNFNFNGHKMFTSKDHFEVYIEDIQNDNKPFKRYESKN